MSETPQDYPNIRAMAAGTISGAWREWPLVRGEAKALLAERDALRAEVARLDAGWREANIQTLRNGLSAETRAVMRALITEATAIIDARRALAPEEKP
jgi:hypothetical protein